MSIEVYGIPNCDTVKKARAWLDEHGVDYTFHDFKKEGVHAERLDQWSNIVGWETLLNSRGTTFRKLDEADKADLDAGKAMVLMQAHTSLIKRPVVEHRGGVLVGFDAETWDKVLA